MFWIVRCLATLVRTDSAAPRLLALSTRANRFWIGLRKASKMIGANVAGSVAEQRSSRRRRDDYKAFLYIAPTLLVIGVFIY